tara:strand:- start:400 stop:1275 length:876 start_codon:yes stop_codon:yes gene_type:complete
MSSDSKGRSWRARFSRVLGGETETQTPSLNGADAASFALRVEAFDQMRVADVMVPRADIIGVELNTPLDELSRLFADAAHSRLPIYRETLDDPVGMAHIKDVIIHLAPDGDGNRVKGWAESKILPAIRRPLLFAPPSMRATDLLLRMQTKRMHLALVVDEYGGTDGLVTLEDLLEPIVGDIEDEHDEADAPAFKLKGPGLWDAEARTGIEDFEAATGRPLTGDDDEDIETLGGLVFMLAGRIPERGEVIPHPEAGLEFEVLDADPRKIKRLRVRAAAPSDPDGERGPDDIA